MPPRHQTLPPAQTSSARQAQKSFYCALCSKGYSRMNDYEAHLSSYDHTHKQRLKDMKAMVRDPAAVARARRAEAKADALVTIELGAAPGGEAGAASGSSTAPGAGDAAGGATGGFKKSGFKKSGFKSAFAPPEGSQPAAAPEPSQPTRAPPPGSTPLESDTDDEGYDVYDPRFPTD